MQVDTDTNNTNADPVEASFSKHLDIAIEAQDGKAAETPNSETPAGNENNENKSEEKGAEQQSKDSESSDSNTGAQPKPDEKDKKEAKPAHGSKDLVLDDKTVIKGGMERRLYEGRELARQQLTTERTAHDRTRGMLEEAVARLASAQDAVKSIHGIGAEQLALGVKIVTDLQRDPQGTLKKLLAEAVNQGYKIEGISEGIDLVAVQRMIDERLPKQEEGLTQEQINNEALAEANAFYTNHPDAKPHDELLGNVLRDHPDLSLQDAYYQLKSAFIDKGFDWSLTLQQNLAAMQSADPANSNANNNPNPTPLPNGGNSANADFKSADLIGSAGDDMDTDAIVREAMRESGLNI